MVLGSAGALALGLALSWPAAAGEEGAIKAFASWQGRGRLFETGPKEATFVGSLAGTMYVETEKGPLASGALVCPAMVRINLEDGSQMGTGRCTITAKDGARVYAEVSCTGVHLIGCDGDFKLTGGTGRFEGVTGGGPLTLRSDFRELAASSDGSLMQEAAGIIYWRELQYKIP
jgi:hypothetical protein